MIRVLTNALNQFLKIVEKPDSITNLSNIVEEDSLLEIVEFLLEIIEILSDFICPECGQTS